MTKEKAIVVDVDGVLLDSYVILKEIFDLGLKGDDMWPYFHEHCNSDRVTFIKDMFPVISSLSNDVNIILSTARNETCRKATEEKLKRSGLTYHSMYMREENDGRHSSEVKRDHLTAIAEDFDIIAFIDDDLGNCQMAKELGILSLRKV